MLRCEVCGGQIKRLYYVLAPETEEPCHVCLRCEWQMAKERGYQPVGKLAYMLHMAVYRVGTVAQAA